MKIKKMICIITSCLCFLLCYSANLKTSSDTIVFGQTADLEGPLNLYGNTIKTGILARINRCNDQEELSGKRLKLISLNDSGDPLQSKKNINSFLKDGVDMFIGNMGTRSILRVLSMIRKEKIAMFFPWSGDDRLRDPVLTNIINGPGLLNIQLDAIVNYIEKNIKLHKLAIFSSDDDFSMNAANYLKKELVSRTKQYVAMVSYNRFTMDITKAADYLLTKDPKIIICISTSMPVVKLISMFFEYGHYGTTFFGIDSTLFVENLEKERGVDFYYTSAVPDPKISKMPIAKKYLEDLQKYFPNQVPNVLSFTYYISMSIIIEAIKGMSGAITKEKIIRKIETMKNYSIDGFVVNFGSNNRHAFGQEISIIKG